MHTLYLRLRTWLLATWFVPPEELERDTLIVLGMTVLVLTNKGSGVRGQGSKGRGKKRTG